MVDWEAFYGAFRQPEFLPGFEILHHIGGGAFGEVYKAKKASIGKAYAIKFLKLDDETTRRAIERELEQVRHFAAIDHPNLVTIEDMGVAGDVPYVIMGYAGEDTLAKRIRRRELPQAEALSVFRQMCAGVAALHERRLAHFDLKPSNVFLNGDVARIGDYGLAKLLSEGERTLSVGRGTPQYMAPEMLEQRADHRADIYALGLILFECLAFQPAFPESAWGGVLREDDRPPTFPVGFPKHIERVIARAVRRDPLDRYQDVAALVAELEPGREPVADVAPPRAALGVDELRDAARQLARGAAGVAHGVWSGVRGRFASGAASATPRPAAPEFGAEVLQVSGLGGPAREATDARADASTPLRPLFPYGPGAAGATLPVPPRFAGGPLEIAITGFLLGGEILGGLVTGPFLLTLRSVARAVDRSARRLPRAFARAASFLVFLVLCLLFGGLAGALVLALFTFSTL
ncbi:MAG: serine/threonine-protein kinase [Planctomycetota bacterium]